MRKIPLVKIEPEETFSLSHSVDEFVCSPNKQYVIATGPQWRQQSLLTGGLKVNTVMLDDDLGWAKAASVNNSGRFFAVILGREHGLLLNDLHKFSSYKVSDCTTSEACIFDDSGRLWSAYISGRNVVVEVFDSSSERNLLISEGFVMRKFVQDPRSSFRFFNFFGSNVFLQTMDSTGVKTYVVTLDDNNQLALNRLGGLNQKRLLAYSEHGEVIGLSDEAAGFQKINTPFGKVSQSCPYPLVTEPDEMGNWANMDYHGCYLDWVHILVASTTRRFFVLNTRSMQVVKEIEVTGISAIDFCKFDEPPMFERCGDFVFVLSPASRPKRSKILVLSINKSLIEGVNGY